MNKVIMVGNLVRDPELTTTANGINVCRFSVAVNRRFANAEGERDVDFFNCVAWRATADFVSKYFKKGSKIGFVGSLQSRNYEAQDGSKRYVTEIVVDEVEFVTSKNASYDDGEPVEASKFSDSEPSTEAKSKIAKFEPIDDDDLPF